MMVAVAVIGWVLFGLAILVGLLLDLLGLFGNWVILATITLAWVVTGFEHFHPLALAIMLVLAVLGEVLEAGAGAIGAQRFGGGRDAIIAAVLGGIVGGIVGTPVLPIIGTLIGACLGAFVGATALEYSSGRKGLRGAAWTGFGATLGRIGGMLAKFSVGIIMLLVAAWAF